MKLTRPEPIKGPAKPPRKRPFSHSHFFSPSQTFLGLYPFVSPPPPFPDFSRGYIWDA